jgi:hypothetical protein
MESEKQDAAYQVVAATDLLDQRDREHAEFQKRFENAVEELYENPERARQALEENRRRFGSEEARRVMTHPESYFDGPEDTDSKFANPGEPKNVDRETITDLKTGLERIEDEREAMKRVVSEAKEELPDGSLREMPKPTGEELLRAKKENRRTGIRGKPGGSSTADPQVGQ